MSWSGRYMDSWVVDRVMFEFVNQGGCSCCGLTHGGMEMSEFMAMCSDVETDDGKTEKLSPWPKFMVEEVWADRVKFRRILKQGIGRYKELNEKYRSEFASWWLDLDTKDRKRCFMMPKEELQIQFENTFNFKTAYKVVLCSVNEQVEHFEDTGYHDDGATDCEIILEGVLRLHRRAWTVDPEYYESEEGCKFFFDMLLQLGGEHLLPRRPKEIRQESEIAKAKAEGRKLNNDSDDETDDVDTAETENNQATQSFRGDRRLVRLTIFRYFADQAWRKFQKYKENQEQAKEDSNAVIENEERQEHSNKIKCAEHNDEKLSEFNLQDKSN